MAGPEVIDDADALAQGPEVRIRPVTQCLHQGCTVELAVLGQVEAGSPRHTIRATGRLKQEAPQGKGSTVPNQLRPPERCRQFRHRATPAGLRIVLGRPVVEFLLIRLVADIRPHL